MRMVGGGTKQLNSSVSTFIPAWKTMTRKGNTFSETRMPKKLGIYKTPRISYRRHFCTEPFFLFALLSWSSWNMKTIIAHARTLAALRYDIVTHCLPVFHQISNRFSFPECVDTLRTVLEIDRRGKLAKLMLPVFWVNEPTENLQ